MSNLKKIEGGVTTPQGFTAGATYTAIMNITDAIQGIFDYI